MSQQGLQHSRRLRSGFPPAPLDTQAPDCLDGRWKGRDGPERHSGEPGHSGPQRGLKQQQAQSVLGPASTDVHTAGVVSIAWSFMISLYLDPDLEADPAPTAWLPAPPPPPPLQRWRIATAPWASE